MDNEDWRPIRRIRDIDNEIQETIEERVESPKRLRWYRLPLTEFILKIISAFGVLIPLGLFYIQYQKENDAKRNERLSEIYNNVAFDVQTILNVELSEDKFNSANSNLLFLYPSKVALFKNSKLNIYYSRIVIDVNNYVELKKIKSVHDAMRDYYMTIFGTFSWEPKGKLVTDLEFPGKSYSDIVKIIDKLLPLLGDFQNFKFKHMSEDMFIESYVYQNDSFIHGVQLERYSRLMTNFLEEFDKKLGSDLDSSRIVFQNGILEKIND